MTTQIIGTTVALAVLILVLVRELQIGTTHDRLAIGQMDAVVPILGRCHSIAVVLYIWHCAIVVYLVIRERLAQTLTVVSPQTQGYVTSIIVEFAVILSPATQALAITVAQAIADIAILDDAVT